MYRVPTRIFLLLIFDIIAIKFNNYSYSHKHSNLNVLKLEKTCSRQNSKLIREFFAKALLPIYNRYSVPIPNECEYSPFNDIYFNQENNKTKLEANKWKCEFCGKVFLAETYLDSHFTNKHNNTLHVPSNNAVPVCLANLCDIFRCDVLTHKQSSASSRNRVCLETKFNDLKTKCNKIVQKCVPNTVSHDIRVRITNELNENLCSYLTCSKYDELPYYMTQGPNFFIIFVIVALFGICLIAYAVLNHTDLIFDENEVNQINEEVLDDETLQLREQDAIKSSNMNKYKSIINTNSSNNNNNIIRKRKTVTFSE